MPTYLLTWNPERWKWDNIQDDIAHITKKGFRDGQWSSGVTKKIQPNDRVFLMKLGSQKPRGIVASGWATSEVFQDIHWDDESKLAFYVDIHFDTILDPEQDAIFPIELLQDGIYGSVNWTPQASGMSIPDDVAEQLEKDWSKFLNRAESSSETGYADEIDIKNDPPQKILAEIYRILRDTALARRIKEKHNYVCQVCGLEPIQLPNGKFYAEAHHLRPLGKHGGLDVEGNIICVCPNCHVKLDYGVIKLHIGKLQTRQTHTIEERFVRYHNKEIYNKTSYK